MDVKESLESLAEMELLMRSYLREKALVEEQLKIMRKHDFLDKTVPTLNNHLNYIDSSIERTIHQRSKLSEAIDQMTDIKQILVLRERYILGKSWDEICYSLSTNHRTIHRVHNKALESLNEILIQRKEDLS